jgi:AcrR family transcriptional regulator
MASKVTHPVKRRRKSNVREAVVEAAVKLFTEKGYELANLTEVAQRAGVGPSSLYHHFSGKGAILLDMLLKDTRELLEAKRAALMGEDSAVKRLLAVVRVSLGVWSGLPERRARSVWYRPFLYRRGLRLWFGPDPRIDEIERLIAENFEITQNIIWQGMVEGQFTVDDPVMAANAVHKMLELMRGDEVAEMPVPQLSHQIASLIFRMLQCTVDQETVHKAFGSFKAANWRGQEKKSHRGQGPALRPLSTTTRGNGDGDSSKRTKSLGR